MRAGALRHLVQVQYPTTTRDANGGVTQTWTLLATRWAEIKDLGHEREGTTGDRQRADATHEMTIRHLSSLSPRHRVVYNGMTFNIVSEINDDLRNRMQKVLLKRVVS